MERNSSPLSNTDSLDASSPPSSPTPSDVPAEGEVRKKKVSRKKRKTSTGEDGGDQDTIRKHKKPKQRRKQVSDGHVATVC